jgi:hypothetical protein
MAQFRNVCFTVNNPAGKLTWPDFVSYGVYQLERGENGTLHWQGYAELSRPVRLTVLKKWLQSAHFEKRHGSDVQARDYCMKRDETYVDGPWEHGTFVPSANTQGKRNDIQAVIEAVDGGASRMEIYREHGGVAARHPRYVDSLLQFRAAARAPKLPPFVALYGWQDGVMDMIAEPPNDREILWVFDAFGNSGKTYLARYLRQEHGAFYCNGGKGVDICYAYDCEPIVIFDYVRDAKDFVNYGVIEQLKNGILTSSKYESRTKIFATPHVIVFANFAPDSSKFSVDRLHIVELNSVHNIMRV